MGDMSRFYTDTDRRMATDPEFAGCVMMLMRFADQFGYTPGELKQIAFRAALELEMRRPGCHVLTSQQLDELDAAAQRRVSLDEMQRLVELVQTGALKP